MRSSGRSSRKRGRAIESDRLRTVLEARKTLGAQVFRIEQQHIRSEFLVIDAELLEQPQHEITDAGIVVESRHRMQQVLRSCFVLRRKFEQVITPTMHQSR